MPRHRLTPREPVEVSRTGRHCESDQTFLRGALILKAISPLREKAVWPRETRWIRSIYSFTDRFDRFIDRFNRSVDRFDRSVDRFDRSVDRFDRSVDRFDRSVDRFDRSVDRFDRSIAG